MKMGMDWMLWTFRSLFILRVKRSLGRMERRARDGSLIVTEGSVLSPAPFCSITNEKMNPREHRKRRSADEKDMQKWENVSIQFIDFFSSLQMHMHIYKQAKVAGGVLTSEWELRNSKSERKTNHKEEGYLLVSLSLLDAARRGKRNNIALHYCWIIQLLGEWKMGRENRKTTLHTSIEQWKMEN